MSHLFFRSALLVSTGSLALLLGACEETGPAQSQYMGGVYGNNPVSTSAPRDSVSYWDGDGVSGKPSVKIKLAEQRAYFTKAGNWSASRSSRPAAKSSARQAVPIPSSKRMSRTSPANSATTLTP